MNTTTNSIIDAVGTLAALQNYYQNVQLTAAVVASVVVGPGLLLAFILREDEFNAKLPHQTKLLIKFAKNMNFKCLYNI